MARDWQGSKWIRREKRLAIYLRDGLACAYCGTAVEDGAQLSLDHLTPHSHGGSNDATNLVTACRTCNSARGNRSVAEFCAAVASYLATTPAATIARIERQRHAPLNVAAARKLIANRTMAEAQAAA